MIRRKILFFYIAQKMSEANLKFNKIGNLWHFNLLRLSPINAFFNQLLLS